MNIVERLRKSGATSLEWEAADEIERLKALHDNAKHWEAQWLAEIERLRTHVQTAGDQADMLAQELELSGAREIALEKEIDCLRAELAELRLGKVAALKRALQEVRSYIKDCDHEPAIDTIDAALTASRSQP